MHHPSMKPHNRKRRSLLAMTGAAITLPHLWIPKANAAGQVIIRSPGGVYDDTRRELIYEPFRKETGIEVVPVATTSAKLDAMIKSGHIELDIIDISMQSLTRLKAHGSLLPIPYKEFKYTDPTDIEDAYRLEHTVGNFTYAQAMAFNTNAYTLEKGPKDWAQFWDAQRFPGPRMLADVAAGTPDLEAALLADGVPMDKLYPLDIKRAFEVLSRIRPSIHKFWDTGSLSGQMLTNKEVVMGSIWSSRLLALTDAGAPLVLNWNQHQVQVQAYGIMKGAPNAGNAAKLIDYCLSKDVQQRYFARFTAGPVTKSGYASLSAARRENVPGGDRTARQGYIVDSDWWGDDANKRAVGQAWSKWILAK